jgi:CHAT domain-containing protein
VIVSDGALQYIPFGALPVPDSLLSVVRGQSSESTITKPQVTGYRPVVIDHEIVSVPSASVLAVLRRELAARQPAAKTVAALADPVFASDDPRVKHDKKKIAQQAKTDSTFLAGATALANPFLRSAREMGVTDSSEGLARLFFSRREAEGILKLVPAAEGMKAVDFAANRATATSAELSRYRMVHFATHGLLNSTHPELSGIVLSLVDEQGKPQDGFLRLHEIYNLNLPADLVVLSACQTALGKEIKGEGLVGLTRGFMYAGATRVAASLWKVDDRATAELMRRFYEGMLGGKKLRPAAALRAAQASLWKEERWRSPYYWAAFVLQGEWR